MKLAKLSLAAIVAAGALTTVNAKPLEEAIKGVDFSGMLRYRLNDKVVETAGKDTHTSNNDWDFLAKFTAPVTDDIKAVMAFASSSADTGNIDSTGISTAGVDLRKMFFVYNSGALTVKAGQQALGLPTTDNGFNGNKGNGVLALYNAGVATFAAAYFSGANINNSALGATIANDSELMAVAAIGSMGPVNAQLWVAKVQDLIDTWTFVQLDGKVAGFSLAGQYIHTKLDNNIAGLGAIAEDSGSFYAFKAGYAVDNFKFNAGYTKTDDKQPLHGLEEDVNTDVISGGWRLMDDGNDYVADQQVIFADASVAFGPYGVTLGYATADVDSAANADSKEIWGQVSYQVAKNMETYLKYSDLNHDVNTQDQQYIRFEAKYSF